MLSIGKLSHLAQLHDAKASIDQTVLDGKVLSPLRLNNYVIHSFLAFHDGLDFVSVHEALVTEFKSSLASVRGRQPLDAQIDTIVKAKAMKMSDAPFLLTVSFFLPSCSQRA
jgi:nuclear pore complex protein Nup133